MIYERFVLSRLFPSSIFGVQLQVLKVRFPRKIGFWKGRRTYVYFSFEHYTIGLLSAFLFGMEEKKEGKLSISKGLKRSGGPFCYGCMAYG